MISHPQTQHPKNSYPHFHPSSNYSIQITKNPTSPKSHAQKSPLSPTQLTKTQKTHKNNSNQNQKLDPIQSNPVPQRKNPSEIKHLHSFSAYPFRQTFPFLLSSVSLFLSLLRLSVFVGFVIYLSFSFFFLFFFFSFFFSFLSEACTHTE